MSDLIKRSDAIDAVDKYYKDKKHIARSRTVLSAICQDMKSTMENLPSAEPKWIPCSERLPEDDAMCIVQYQVYREEDGDIWIGWHEMDNVWYIDGEEHSQERGNEVIAWMPLPPNYKGEQENER